MDITQLLTTTATVLAGSAGVAIMILLAVVPTWLRYDAERAPSPSRHGATRAKVEGAARDTDAATTARPRTAQPERHALAA